MKGLTGSPATLPARVDCETMDSQSQSSIQRRGGFSSDTSLFAVCFGLDITSLVFAVVKLYVFKLEMTAVTVLSFKPVYVCDTSVTYLKNVALSICLT